MKNETDKQHIEDRANTSHSPKHKPLDLIKKLSSDNTKEQDKRVDHHDNPLFAKRYDELATKFLNYECTQREFKTLVRKDQPSLEIGIGSGLFALPLIKQGYSIDGLEPNTTMGTILAQNAQAQGLRTPKVEQVSVDKFPFNTSHPIIYSHSGPMFVTREEGQLYYEGLNTSTSREAEIAENISLLKRILTHISSNNGKFLLNIQENKTGIQLSDGSTYNLAPVDKGYDPKNLEVTKQYRFIEKNGSVLPNGGERTYRRFACTIDQLSNFIKSIGDFNLHNYKDIWLIIDPQDQSTIS
jgi:hypothetical protein